MQHLANTIIMAILYGLYACIMQFPSCRIILIGIAYNINRKWNNAELCNERRIKFVEGLCPVNGQLFRLKSRSTHNEREEAVIRISWFHAECTQIYCTKIVCEHSRTHNMPLIKTAAVIWHRVQTMASLSSTHILYCTPALISNSASVKQLQHLSTKIHLSQKKRWKFERFDAESHTCARKRTLRVYYYEIIEHFKMNASNSNWTAAIRVCLFLTQGGGEEGALSNNINIIKIARESC